MTPLSQIRNFMVVAHIEHGKSTPAGSPPPALAAAHLLDIRLTG